MAAAFGTLCRPSDVIGLEGTLGAGKTCFVKGLAAGLGVEQACSVVSPTFVLLRRYAGRLTLYHFDAYRLHDGAEMEDIGCADLFAAGGVSAVEWADHVRGCLPEQHFMLSINVTGERERDFALMAVGARPRERLGAFRRTLAPWLV